MPLGYMEISPEYYITDWNPFAQSIYGYAKQEVLGRNIYPLLIRDLPHDFFEQINISSNQENRAFRRIETYTNDGRRITCDWYITPLHDYYHNLYGWVIIFQDRSEMIRAQEELQKAKEIAEEANISKGFFLANVSHEIRTPLNAIIGFSSLMTAGVTDPASIRYLQSINSAGKALLQLINDILDLSKMEAHKLELVYTHTDLNRLCSEIDMILEQRASEKGLQFTLNLPDHSYIMLVDENRMRQVLLNLVGNAIKFTNEGSVTLSLEVDQKEDEFGDIYFRIRDTGIGIPKQDHKRVFLPFEQQNPEQKTSFGGTGLGLAISEKLVAAMGGKISLISEPLQGSEFTVFIPHVKSLGNGRLSGGKTPVSSVPVRFEPAVILIIDDVESNRNVLSDMVQQLGLSPVSASSAFSALLLMKSEIPAVILTDLCMPEMNGEEFLHQVRSTDNYPGIPIVAVTARVISVDEAIYSYFDGFLFKPVQIGDLSDMLIKFLPVKKDTGEQTNESARQDTFDKLPDKPALLMRDRILPRMMSVSQLFSLRNAREIADEIELIAEEEECSDLFQIASDFRNAADNFDLRRIKEIIRFVELISSV